MSRGKYSPAKRQRETDKQRKKQEKAQRRQEKRDRGPREIEIVSASDIIGDVPTPEEAMRAIEARAQAPRSAASVPARLFVGGLGDRATAAALKQLFEQFGPVADAFVVTDRDTGASRGFGFVTMEDRKDAARAIEELDGTDFDGRRLAVNVATERSR